MTMARRAMVPTADSADNLPIGNWYLVYTKARQEYAAAQGLREQDYVVYLPRLCQRRRVRGRLTNVIGVLFPRYLFVAPGRDGQSIAPVGSTPGVQKLVRFGALFLPVGENVIAALKAREDPDSGCHRLAPPALQPGARVRIDTGPFAGLDGIFEARVAQDRVVILLDLLGQQARTVVTAGEIGV
jgi:transcriptional antiterminator RfaH